MEYLHGQRLVEALQGFYSRVAQSKNMTVEEMTEDMRRRGATPPSEATLARYAMLSVSKAWAYNTVAFMYNWTLGFVAPNLSYASTGEEAENEGRRSRRVSVPSLMWAPLARA